jgi:hypothetical protein
VEPQATDSVVHAAPKAAWFDALFGFFRPSDQHVSDEEIFEIVSSKDGGVPVSELCAAKGVTVPMYCVWKSKYRHLTLDELRKSRRQALWRARCQFAGCLAAAVLAAGTLVFGIARVAYARASVAVETPAPLPSVPVIKSALAEPAFLGRRSLVEGGSRTAAPPVAAPAPTPHTPPVERRSNVDAPGYKIQVAAAESLGEGRAIVDRLASAGYRAYVARAVVGDTEVFRVRIGPFDTLSAAEGVTSALKRDGYTGAWIAR